MNSDDDYEEEKEEEEEEEEVPEEVIDMYPKEERFLIKMVSGMTSTAFKTIHKTGAASIQVGKLLYPIASDRSKMMREFGKYVKDLRDVAGLTINDLNEALDLSDQSLLEAVENGTATLSFDLTLRMAALLARHDPIPFIIRSMRTYNPEAWGVLEDWGVGRICIHIERERQFLNIYRSHDGARELTDESYKKVLDFTRAAFETALQFAFEQEDIDED